MKKFYAFLLLLTACIGSNNTAKAQSINIAGPAGSGQFGGSVTVLTNGNYVVVDALYDEGAVADVGAVYLYNGITHALIATLKGSTASDQVGSSGITALSNGNYVVRSPLWDNGAIVNAGAATWRNGSSGVSGVVSSSNSLVGSTASDQVGATIVALTNGNYVVSSTLWDRGAIVNAGAATWGNGSSGVSGVVSSSNSLVGSTASDQVGVTTALTNGNYVVSSIVWDNGAIVNAGSVTWGNGSSGFSGVVSSSNSLVGSTVNDYVGYVRALSNGNYVVYSENWDNGGIANVGAVTWGNGNSGITGVVSSSNSLVGSTVADRVGSDGITALSNGNYVVISLNWDNGAIVDAGAVTWRNGSSGGSGVVSSSNSLVGGKASDQVGSSGLTTLSNGNYVVRSPLWDNGAIVNAGAVTWGNGNSGVSGVVSSSNSLVGSTASDQIGSGGITALSNGNYVVNSSGWDNGAIVNVGAVTWGNGSSGFSGVVSSSNSLVGSTASDQVGVSIAALSNGNYVVGSPFWDNGAIVNAGAATWGNGSTGITGVVSSSNSLVGSTVSDQVGNNWNFVTALSSGNYVVNSSLWDNGAIVDAGAATWGNGSTGVTGVISSSNSLVGSTASDQVGIGGITALSNGNYVVNSFFWDNGAIVDAGAATWGNGSSGVSGVVNSSNSLVGSTASDQVGGYGITALSNGNYVVRLPLWDNGAIVDAGAATWGNGSSGVSGVVSSSNSLVGSTTNDQVGNNGITAISNGNYVVNSSLWDNGAIVNSGAVTWGNGSSGVSGIITTCNSVRGTAASGGSTIIFVYNGVNDYLIVGRRADNIVTIYNAAGISLTLANSLDVVNVNINGTNAVPLIANAGCRIIATLTPNGGSAISGIVNAKVWIEAVQPSLPYYQYVKRHYEITPANNAATATAKVTLYFTQQEFDDFNAVSNVKLPQGPGDMSGIGNMLVEKRGGVSSDGSGLPATYSGTIETINPQDVDIIWNATNLRWEVSFDVTGFSGFFLKTYYYPLPVQWLQVNANLNSQDKAVINWQVQEQNSAKYFIEKSIDGINFTAIGYANSKGDGTNSYSFTESVSLSGTAYYRIKQIQNGGHFSYSAVQKLSTFKTQSITVYPNPVINVLTITTGADLLKTRTVISDISGKTLSTIMHTNLSTIVDVSWLAKGVYLLKFEDGTCKKIIKQ